MLGLMIDEKEKVELEYLLKREMDEIIFDLQDERMNYIVKRSIGEKYTILFQLFKRLSTERTSLNYYEGKPILNKKNQHNKNV